MVGSSAALWQQHPPTTPTCSPPPPRSPAHPATYPPARHTSPDTLRNEDKLSTLQTEAYAQSRAAQKAEAQASLLPETEKKLRELQTAMSQRQLQLQEARAKQKKKKGKGKKKAG